MLYISCAIKSIWTETENYFLYNIQCIIPWASTSHCDLQWYTPSFQIFSTASVKKKAIPGNFVSATMIMIMYIFYISPDQIFKETDSITSNGICGWLA